MIFNLGVGKILFLMEEKYYNEIWIIPDMMLGVIL